jgi:hypothetical protein
MKYISLFLLLVPLTLWSQNPVNSVPEGALIIRISPEKWYQDAAKAEIKEIEEKSIRGLVFDLSKSPENFGINTNQPIWIVGNTGKKDQLTIMLSLSQEEDFKQAFKEHAGIVKDFDNREGKSFLSDDELTVMLNNGIATLQFGKLKHFYESSYRYRNEREELLREIHAADTNRVPYGEDNVQIIEEPVMPDIEVEAEDAVETAIEVPAETYQRNTNDDEWSYSELERMYRDHPRLIEFDERWEAERAERKRLFMERQYREREEGLVELMKNSNPNALWRSHLPNSKHDVSIFFQVSDQMLPLVKTYRRYRSRSDEDSRLEQYFNETYTLTHVDFLEGEMVIQTISEQSDLFTSDPILTNKKLKRSTRKMMPKDPYMYYTYHTDAEAMAELYMDLMKALFQESDRRDSKMALAAIQTVYLLLDDDVFDDALDGGGFVALTGQKELIRESKSYVYDTASFEMTYKTVLDTSTIPEYVWVSHLGEDDFIPKLLEIGVDGGVLALDSNTGYFIQPDLSRGRQAAFQFYVGIINDHICVSNNANLLDSYRAGLSRKERISMSRDHLINQTGNTMYINMDGIADAILTTVSGMDASVGGDEKTEQIKRLKELFGEISWRVEQDSNRSEGTMKVETKEGQSSLVMLFELLSSF